MIGKHLSASLLLLVALLSIGVIGLAGTTVAQDTSQNLTETNVLLEDASPGDTVDVEIEFNKSDSVTVSLLYNETQNLTFTDENGNSENLSVVSGGTHNSTTLSATAENINQSQTGTYWDVSNISVAFPSVNGTLDNPESLDFQVQLTGENNNSVVQTAVEGPGSTGGLFSSFGGDSTTQSLLLFGLLVAAVWYAREQEVI